MAPFVLRLRFWVPKGQDRIASSLYECLWNTLLALALGDPKTRRSIAEHAVFSYHGKEEPAGKEDARAVYDLVLLDVTLGPDGNKSPLYALAKRIEVKQLMQLRERPPENEEPICCLLLCRSRARSRMLERRRLRYVGGCQGGPLDGGKQQHSVL